MPYRWTETPNGPVVLELSAHNALTPRGFAWMIGLTAGMISLPLFSLLGTVLLWWLLPFLAAAVGALWWALKRSHRDRAISEVLERAGDELTLRHRPAKGAVQTWSCNIYWTGVHLHEKGGPVEAYVTLTGNGRMAEIGRFLSEDERRLLFSELSEYVRNTKEI